MHMGNLTLKIDLLNLNELRRLCKFIENVHRVIKNEALSILKGHVGHVVHKFHKFEIS